MKTIKELKVNFIYSIEKNPKKTNYNISLLNNRSELINNYELKNSCYNDLIKFCLNKTLQYYGINKNNIETIFYNDILHLFNQH